VIAPKAKQVIDFYLDSGNRCPYRWAAMVPVGDELHHGHDYLDVISPGDVPREDRKEIADQFIALLTNAWRAWERA
jgi:hypothetical protein